MLSTQDGRYIVSLELALTKVRCVIFSHNEHIASVAASIKMLSFPIVHYNVAYIFWSFVVDPVPEFF